MFKKSSIVWVSNLLLGLTWFWILCNGFQIRDYSKTECSTNKADVAIVLGAGVTKDQKVSPVFRERLNHAFLLYTQGKVKRVLITGGYGKNGNQSDSKIGRTYLTNLGMAPNHILIEEQSVITYENLKFARKLMEQGQLTSSLIVSDPYHMKRAMSMCDQLKISAFPSPTTTSMYRSRKTKVQFLFFESLNYCGYQMYGRFRKID